MGWCFYIISNANQTLYAGITSNLVSRIREHKSGAYENAFTTRYNFDRLVYLEWFPDQLSAAKREREVKGWRRSRKIDLIAAKNPQWKDLSLDWLGLLSVE